MVLNQCKIASNGLVQSGQLEEAILQLLRKDPKTYQVAFGKLHISLENGRPVHLQVEYGVKPDQDHA